MNYFIHTLSLVYIQISLFSISSSYREKLIFVIDHADK